MIAISAPTEEPLTSLVLPPLKNGDVVQIAPHPFKVTVGGAERTIFQIARLGYPSVVDFQRARGLKGDNIIGPNTRDAARKLYVEKFGVVSNASENSHSLTLAGEAVMENGSQAIRVTISNADKIPIRIIGRVGADKRGRFRLEEFQISLASRFCDGRPGGLIVCGTQHVLGERIPAGTTLEHRNTFRTTAKVPATISKRNWRPHMEFFDHTLRRFELEGVPIEITPVRPKD